MLMPVLVTGANTDLCAVTKVYVVDLSASNPGNSLELLNSSETSILGYFDPSATTAYVVANPNAVSGNQYAIAVELEGQNGEYLDNRLNALGVSALFRNRDVAGTDALENNAPYWGAGDERDGTVLPFTMNPDRCMPTSIEVEVTGCDPVVFSVFVNEDNPACCPPGEFRIEGTCQAPSCDEGTEWNGADACIHIECTSSLSPAMYIYIFIISFVQLAAKHE